MKTTGIAPIIIIDYQWVICSHSPSPPLLVIHKIQWFLGAVREGGALLSSLAPHAVKYSLAGSPHGQSTNKQPLRLAAAARLTA